MNFFFKKYVFPSAVHLKCLKAMTPPVAMSAPICRLCSVNTRVLWISGWLQVWSITYRLAWDILFQNSRTLSQTNGVTTKWHRNQMKEEGTHEHQRAQSLQIIKSTEQKSYELKKEKKRKEEFIIVLNKEKAKINSNPEHYCK